LKRQLVHVGAFHLSLIPRRLLGAGTPRELRNRFGRLVLFVYLLFQPPQFRKISAGLSQSAGSAFFAS
jgi:hypothetical protein